MDISTNCAHAGLCTDPATGAISTPIYQTATFRHPGLGQSTGWDYSRSENPTRCALEECVAALEGGTRGFAFATGMAAITAVLTLFAPGDHLIVSDDLYGGTYRVLEKIFARSGLKVSFVDVRDSRKVEAAWTKQTAACLIETPTNPLLKIADISALAARCKSPKALLIVDNTFMTPYLQKPMGLGADIVVHSGSKYLAGHNDTLSGLVVTNTPELAERMDFIQNSTGGVLSPLDSWLTLRGIKTLGIRMDRAMQNAQHIARWLEEHPAVTSVRYPGLESHPDRELHASQARGPGAMISFTVKDAAAAARVINRVRVVSFAESLGGVESLITYPALQTHADVPKETREALGITDGLLRLSVGIEHDEDIIDDLNQAL